MNNQVKFRQKLDDPNGIVSKLIFESDEAIAESVLYHYHDRVVVCFSTQSGCPVGCVFCGTGNKFIRNLSTDEMLMQIETSLDYVRPIKGKKVQLMSMSMGEPTMNWVNLYPVIDKYLERGMYFFVSTIGLDHPGAHMAYNDCIYVYGKMYKKFGLQFSLHDTNDETRQKLFRNKDLKYLSIEKMIEVGHAFKEQSGNPAYYNYIVTDKETDEQVKFLVDNFRGLHITCSVKCSTTHLSNADAALAQNFANRLFKESDGQLNVSVFDPAGQSTIGGGCGQLFTTQEKMRKLSIRKYE